jgi:hypothetical protein
MFLYSGKAGLLGKQSLQLLVEPQQPLDVLVLFHAQPELPRFEERSRDKKISLCSLIRGPSEFETCGP